MRQAKIYVTEKVSALRTGFNLYQVRLKSGRFIMADIMNTDKLVQVVHTYQRDNYFGFFFLILSSDLNQKFLNYGSMVFDELNFTFPSSSREYGSPNVLPRSHVNIPLTHDNGAISLHEVSA